MRGQIHGLVVATIWVLLASVPLEAAPGGPTPPSTAPSAGGPADRGGGRPADEPKGDWSDLEDNEFKLFGSDKEAKLPLSLKPIAEIEDWKDPDTRDRFLSYKLFWLGAWAIKINRYPKFDRFRIFPYSRFESRIDNRAATWLFPLYYWQRDGHEQTTLWPLIYQFESKTENIGLYGPYYTYRNEHKRARHLFPLIYSGSRLDGTADYFAFAPLIYTSSKKYGDWERTRTLLPLLYISQRTHATDPERNESFHMSPLHYYNREGSTRTIGLPLLPLVFYRHRTPERSHTNVLVLFDAQYEKSKLERLWAFPLLFYRRGGEGYLHVAPPLFMRITREGYDYTHFLGLPFINYRSADYDFTMVSPFFFSSRTKLGEHTTVRRNLLWLVDWKTETGVGLRRLVAFPLLYYRRYEDGTHTNVLGLLDTATRDGRRERLWVMPLFFDGRDSYRHVLPPLYMSFREGGSGYRHFLPLYFHGWTKTEAGEDERMLVFPLFYHSSEGQDTHTNVLGLVDVSYSGETRKRTWVMPLLFDSPDAYRHVLPPLYMSFRDREGGYRHLLPLYYHSWNTTGPERDEQLLVLPLFYRSWAAARSHTNVLGLFDLSYNGEKRERLWFMPFVFHGTDSYLHFVPPLYMSFRDAEGGTYRHLLPLFLRWNSRSGVGWFLPPLLLFRDTEQSELAGRSRLISPLFRYEWTKEPESERTSLLTWLYYRFREQRSDESGRSFHATDATPLFFYSRTTASGDAAAERRSTLWFPILPLYYRSHETERGSHYNTLLLADWATDKLGALERFWLLPLAYYRRNEYLHVFPFFFRPFGSDEERGWSVGPLYYHSWSPDRDRRWLGLFYSAHDNEDQTATTVLFPLLFEWQRKDSRGQIFLPLFATYSDRQKYVSIWVFGGSRTRQTGQLQANVGVSEKGLWYIDVDYSLFYNLFSFAYRQSIFAPDASEVPGVTTIEKSAVKTGRAGPSRAPPKTVAAKSAKSAAEKSAPATPEGRIAGGKQGESGGQTGPGQNGELASGLTPSLDFFDRVDVEGKNEARRRVEAKAPKLTKRPELTRETAKDFWGVSALFGLFAMQRADTERHFRIFPFAWFTWDTRYEDTVYWLPLPPFVHYESEDLAFTAVVPFYGRQRSGKSTLSAYGLFLFLDQYDDEIKEQSYSVLWPLVNWYSSPERDGFRVLPLLWNRNVHQADGTEGRRFVFFPLVFHKSDGYRATDAGEPRQHRSSWTLLFPLAFWTDSGVFRKSAEKEEVVTRSQSLFGLPLLYGNRTEGHLGPGSSSRTFFLLGYYDYEHQDADQSRYTSSSFLFGLFRRTKRTDGKQTIASSVSLLYGLLSSSGGSGDSKQWFLPLYYGSRVTRVDGPVERVRAIPMLLTWWTSSGPADDADSAGDRRSSFYSPLYVSRNTQSTDRKSSLALFPLLPLPLLYRSEKNGDVEWDWLRIFHLEKPKDGPLNWRIFPLWFYESGPSGHVTVFPLVWHYGDEALGETAFHLLPPLLMTWRRPKEWFAFAAGLYLQSSETRSRQNFLFLFDRQKNHKTGSYDVSMLFNFFEVAGGPKEDFRLHVAYGLLFGLEDDLEQDRYSWNFLWMLNSRRGPRFESSFIPFYYYESLRDERRQESTLHVLPPLYLSWSDAEESTRFVAGLYLHSSERRSRQNFLYLFDREKNHKTGEYSYGFLLQFFHAQGGPERSFRFDVAYGLLFGLSDPPGENNYEWNFLWMLNERRPTRLDSVFLPFWWYESYERRDGSKSREMWVPPLLSYFDLDSRAEGTDRYLLLGGIYLRSSPKYSRQNFYFLFDHIDDRARDRSHWSLLFHSMYYERSRSRTTGGLLYRLVGGFDYGAADDYDFNALWYVQYRDKHEFHSSFIPLWYYSSGPDRHLLVVPPLLAYSSRDRGGLFQLVGLGTLWYRNYDAATLDDSQQVLLGALYGASSRAQNGFSSHSSLWGFLWQYQSESETGYRKFSVLRLPFYKRVRRDGRLRTTILWISTD